MIGGGRGRTSRRAATTVPRALGLRTLSVVGAAFVAAAALVFVSIGSASALEGGPSSSAVTIELIPATSATVDAPSAGLDPGTQSKPAGAAAEVTLGTAASRALSDRDVAGGAAGRNVAGAPQVLTSAEVRVAGVRASVESASGAAGSGGAAAGATTRDEGGVSIELIPATSSEVAAPTSAARDVHGTAALPVAGPASAGSVGSGAAVATTAAAPPTTAAAGEKQLSVLAEAQHADSASPGAARGSVSTLPWIIGAVIVVLLGGAAAVSARMRRPVRH